MACMTTRRLLLGVALAAIVSMCSCGSRDTPPRTTEWVFQERLKVDTLYLTEDGGEIVAAGNSFGVIVDPKTKKLAWAAWQCNNPDCQGIAEDERPYLFIRRDPFKFVKKDGTVGLGQPQSQKDFELFEQYAEVTCPACLKTRNREAETAEQRQQYKQWCQRYILPETAARLKELDEQRKRWLEELRRRKNLRP